MSETLDLTTELLRRRSLTPNDAGCQQLLGKRLEAAGFQVESMPFGEVSNLWARRGDAGPLLCFAGHTDVVPSGPEDEWESDPFEPEIRDGLLFGRGAADMKSGLAAMVIACERFVDRHPDCAGSIACLITSDEEGPAMNGTRQVVNRLMERRETITWAVVGEPSSTRTLGDTIRIGRRGSLGGRLVVRGTQGHIAYPDLADNPIHSAVPALSELCNEHWDDGSTDFQPTVFQISNVESGTGATNVIPGLLEAWFNFRYSDVADPDNLRERVSDILDRHNLDFEIDWHHYGKPYYCPPGELAAAASRAVCDTVGVKPAYSTRGGTSDGRFISVCGAEVVELGPVNETIHRINECVPVADLDNLTDIYFRIAEQLLLR